MPVHAAKILVLGSQTTTPFNGDDGGYIYGRLIAEGHNVTYSATIPITISYISDDPVNGYDQVWVFGSATMEAAGSVSTPVPATYTGTPWATPLISFINDGGGVMVFSEVSCCNDTAALAQVVMDGILKLSATAQHGPRRGDPADLNSLSTLRATLTAGTEYSCISTPLPNTDAVRVTDVANSSQTLLTAGDGGPTAVAIFQAHDMTAGKGALAVFGDMNPFKTTGTGAQKEFLVRLFAQALAGAQNPDAGFCATVTGELDVTNLHFDKTIVSTGDTVELQIDIANRGAAAVSTESVTLVVVPGLDLSSVTADLSCPVSGTSTLNINSTVNASGQQIITFSPIAMNPAEACTITMNFTVTDRFTSAPDAARHVPTGLQDGLARAGGASPTPVPGNSPWGMAVMMILMLLAGLKLSSRHQHSA